MKNRVDQIDSIMIKNMLIRFREEIEIELTFTARMRMIINRLRRSIGEIEIELINALEKK